MTTNQKHHRCHTGDVDAAPGIHDIHASPLEDQEQRLRQSMQQQHQAALAKSKRWQ